MRILVGVLLLVSAFSVSFDCGSGSVVNNQGICITPKYIEGCYTYASSTRCQVCAYSYVLLDGKCQFQTNLQKSCCKARDPFSGACKECEAGLFLKNDKCVQNRVIGCLSQDLNGNCLNCDQRFYLEDGTCKLGIQNCQEYTNLGGIKICNRCKAGHSFINNVCVPNSILGCKIEVNKVCSECYSPFVLKSDHCGVPNCKSHNDFGCTVCECGFYLTNDRKCNEMLTGCIRYSRGVCTDCMNGFVLKGNVCEIEGCLTMEGVRCSQCKDGYVSTDNGCQMVNCLLSHEGVCSVCKQGFRLKTGVCVQQKLV